MLRKILCRKKGDDELILAISHWENCGADILVQNLLGMPLVFIFELWNILSGCEVCPEAEKLVGKGPIYLFCAFVDFIILAKLGLTWDQLSALSISGVDERSLRRKVAGLSIHLRESWETIVRPTLRFAHLERGFANVTAILDGTPAPTRARGASYATKSGKKSTKNYSGKYKIMCRKFEIWCTLQGCPIGFRGPRSGSEHDMQFFNEPIPFPHREGELFLADLGYLGAVHMLTPYKSDESPGITGGVSYDPQRDVWETHTMTEVTLEIHKDRMQQERRLESYVTRDEYFNIIQPRLRSRVERMFARLMSWKWFSHYDPHSEAWAEGAMRLMIFCTHHRYKYEGSYGPILPRAPKVDPPPAIKCSCSGKGTPEEIKAAKEARDILCDRLWPYWDFDGSKRPAKRSKHESPTKECRMIEQMKQYWQVLGELSEGDSDFDC